MIGKVLYNNGMDVLGDIVRMISTGPALSQQLEIRSPWALRVPKNVGAGFHIVLQGACWLVPENGSPPLALGPGDLILFPRGAPHVMADDPRTPPVDVAIIDGSGRIDTAGLGGKGTRSLLLSGGYRLDYHRPHPLLAALPDILYVPAAPGCHQTLRTAVTMLGDELESDLPGGSAVVHALVDALFPLIMRAWIESHSDCAIGNWAEVFTDPAIAGSLEQIHAEPDRAWTVAALASEVGLSRATFARRFAQTVGVPPLTYLTTWRMAIASRLLCETNLKIADVADRVGYESEFAFAKAFKRIHGIAPGASRLRLPG
jgi:AraC-like DNA-binding protein